MKKTILVSNDDGIHAIGIKKLAEAIEPYGNILVVAPDRNRSAASQSLTVQYPLRAHKIRENAYAVEGTPADSVHLALNGFFDTDPWMVVSGINEGPNLGDDVIYSGTVAAAIEGRSLEGTSLAFSLAGEGECIHYDEAAFISSLFVEYVLKNPLPGISVLNINVPDLPLHQIKGVQVTRLGIRNRSNSIEKSRDPREKKIYWVGKAGTPADASPGTDFYAVSEGYVSVTPLNMDMTYHSMVDALQNWNLGMMDVFSARKS